MFSVTYALFCGKFAKKFPSNTGPVGRALSLCICVLACTFIFIMCGDRKKEDSPFGGKAHLVLTELYKWPSCVGWCCTCAAGSPRCTKALPHNGCAAVGQGVLGGRQIRLHLTNSRGPQLHTLCTSLCVQEVPYHPLPGAHFLSVALPHVCPIISGFRESLG